MHYLHRQSRQILSRGSNGRVYQHYNRLSVSGVVMFDVTILVTRDNGAGVTVTLSRWRGEDKLHFEGFALINAKWLLL